MANIYTVEGLLFMVQVDHLPGELLGSAIEYLYAAGARNVQMLPSVTKKNRPGHLVIIDAPPSKADDIERIITEELGSTGWHRFKTEHRHLPVEQVVKPIQIDTGSGVLHFELRGKRIKKQNSSVRPEHDSCQELQQLLRDQAGKEISLRQIFASAQNVLRQSEEDTALLTLGQN